MKYFKHLKFKDWNDFKELAEKSKINWIYRGHSNSKWDLKSTLDRSNINKNNIDYEERVLIDFKRGINLYIKDEFSPKTDLEYYSLLQHFGAPTRLLDFTKSPYIAAYFAFEKTNDKIKEIAIWIVDKIQLYGHCLNYFSKNKINLEYNSPKTYNFNDNDYSEIIKESKKRNLNCIIPIEPDRLNRRYYLQQSIFLAQGNPSLFFSKQSNFVPRDKINYTFIKVTLPSSEKSKAIKDLQKMNISRATLFPDLEGYTESLRLKYTNLTSIKEMSDSIDYSRSINLEK
tara:strand:- start:81 stop:938 length:858 start_codon:yes stop_codon:yes gene_type:complete